MKLNRILLIVVFGLVVSTAGLGTASELPQRVETALSILETHNQNAPRFSFERATFKKGERTELKTFDPRRDIPTRWQVSFPSIEDDPKEHGKLQKKYAKWDGNSDKALLVPDLRKRMGNGAVLLRTEDNAEIYAFDVTDEYILEGGGRKSEISKHIKGEIAIDIHTDLIRWIRYYAPEHFKPISIVKLKFYEIIQHVAPAWEDGPFVRVYETSKVRGSAPFTSINVDEIMINKKITPAQ